MDGDMASVKVEIADTDGAETGPIFYKITHWRHGRQWEATQRYSALLSLKESLVRDKIPTANVPFPRKQGFLAALFCLPMTADGVKERRHGLETYLKSMSEIRECWESPLVAEVLCGVTERSGQVDTAGIKAVDKMEVLCGGDEDSAQADAAVIAGVEGMAEGQLERGPPKDGSREAEGGKLWTIASSMVMASLEADGVSSGMFPCLEIGDGTIGMVPPSPPSVPQEVVGGANGIISPSTKTDNKKKGKQRGRKGKKK